MSWNNGHHSELTGLLEALCDDCLSPAQTARLEQLVLADRDARRLYLEYIDLHGTLHWDTAQSGNSESVAAELDTPAIATRHRRNSHRTDRNYIATAAIAVALIVSCGMLARQWFATPANDVPVATHDDNPTTDSAIPAVSVDPRNGTNETRRVVNLPDRRLLPIPSPDQRDVPEPPVVAPDPPNVIADNRRPELTPVGFINDQIAAGWTLAGFDASTRASDSEWVRRVYLDLVGRIPAVSDVEDFLKDQRSNKRELLIERLLDDPAYVANWTTIWTNLLVGRSQTSDDVNRPALQRFLRRSFARNRPWSDVVYDLVSAEGDNEENGATNFLIAHLNNEAVPATAVTARLFLGMQVQCTQCHNHPFNDWKQSHFWELNSCFQQTKVDRRRSVDSKTGKARQTTRLVNAPVAGPIFYENRQSLVLAALPKFMGVSIDAAAETNRRKELARLVVEGDDQQVARSLVNRLWAHFFGFGFTHPIDDMGPHNPVTHPALLDQLTSDFVASGHDIKQLMRWICKSEPYQLSSQFGETNDADNPEIGEIPLFSRMYVKPMTVEQLYDSMMVATQLDDNRGSRWSEAEAERRQQWLQQFVVAYETEENNEASTFDGTLPQALMMMNGDLVQQALSAEGDTYLKRIVKSRESDTDKIRRLFLAALSRYPTPTELAAFRKLLREQTAARGGNRKQAQAEALQDLFWAFLNSSEFILVH